VAGEYPAKDSADVIQVISSPEVRGDRRHALGGSMFILAGEMCQSACPEKRHEMSTTTDRKSLAATEGKRDTTSAHVKAHATGRWAEIIFRALSSRVANRWKFVSFRGADKAEWRGVVDLVAIRKNSRQPMGNLLKRGDLFDIVLIQIKGGSARGPTPDDCRRLREVKRIYRAKEVVQFQWRKGKSSRFFALGRTLEWKVTTSRVLFE